MKILLPTDGSLFSKKAIDYLTNLDTLKESGAVVYLLNIQKKLPPAVKKNLSPLVIDEIFETAHRVILKPARKKLETAGFKVKAKIGLGKAVDNIIKTAKNIKADLIVVGSHGLIPVKGLILGSKPSAVLASCKVPLLVIRENSPMPPPRQQIGICVDGSAYSVAALQFVENHLELFGENPVFHLINVLPERSTSLVSQLPGVGNDDNDEPSEAQEREMFDEMIVPLYEHFRGHDHEVKVALLKGDPAEEISEYAEQANLSLLILGTHGLGHFKAMMMGSTGMKISAETTLPILYVQKRKHKQKEETVEFDPDSVVISEESIIKAHDDRTDLDISVEEIEPIEEEKPDEEEKEESESTDEFDTEDEETEEEESNSSNEEKEKKKDKKKKK